MKETEPIQPLQKRMAHCFEELLTLYKNRVYNTVLGFLQNEADAEDVTQEVFIKLHQSIDGFRGEAALSTWVYRIAVTHSLDFLRTKKRKSGGFLKRLFAGEEDWLFNVIKDTRKHEIKEQLIDYLRQKIGELQSSIDVETYEHFARLQSLLNKDQRLNLHTTVSEILRESTSDLENSEVSPDSLDKVLQFQIDSLSQSR